MGVQVRSAAREYRRHLPSGGRPRAEPPDQLADADGEMVTIVAGERGVPTAGTLTAELTQYEDGPAELGPGPYCAMPRRGCGR